MVIFEHCLLTIPIIGAGSGFSQFFSTPLQLNPAYAGLSDNPHLTAVYRLQWPGLTAAYNTFALGYDQFLMIPIWVLACKSTGMWRVMEPWVLEDIGYGGLPAYCWRQYLHKRRH